MTDCQEINGKFNFINNYIKALYYRNNLIFYFSPNSNIRNM